MTRRRRSSAIIEAGKRGKDAGHGAATWHDFDERSAQRFLQGWDDGDPAIMDQYSPPNFLSGEWAGESIQELLGDLFEDDPDSGEEIIQEYETAADEAYWTELQRAAQYQLPHKRKRNPPRMLTRRQLYL